MATLKEWNEAVNAAIVRAGENFDFLSEELVSQRELNQILEKRILELEKTVAELIILKGNETRGTP